MLPFLVISPGLRTHDHLHSKFVRVTYVDQSLPRLSPAPLRTAAAIPVTNMISALSAIQNQPPSAVMGDGTRSRVVIVFRDA